MASDWLSWTSEKILNAFTACAHYTTTCIARSLFPGNRQSISHSTIVELLRLNLRVEATLQLHRNLLGLSTFQYHKYPLFPRLSRFRSFPPSHHSLLSFCSLILRLLSCYTSACSPRPPCNSPSGSSFPNVINTLSPPVSRDFSLSFLHITLFLMLSLR